MSIADPNIELIGRIRNTPFYQTYEKAFRTATGLPLILVSEKEEQYCPCDDQINRNRFCKMLMGAEEPCEACIVTHHRVVVEARLKPRTSQCFAGLAETVVPIRMGHETLGYLRTGQVNFLDEVFDQHQASRRLFNDHRVRSRKSGGRGIGMD